MADIRITVDSVMGDALDKVERALSPPSITESVGDGADVFVEGARRRAPHRSGRLAASIGKTQVDPFTFEIAPDTIYAGIQEFGGTIHSKPLMVFQDGPHLIHVEVVHLRPHPYMRPTFAEDTPKAVEAVRQSIESNIK